MFSEEESQPEQPKDHCTQLVAGGWAVGWPGQFVFVDSTRDPFPHFGFGQQSFSSDGTYNG